MQGWTTKQEFQESTSHEKQIEHIGEPDEFSFRAGHGDNSLLEGLPGNWNFIFHPHSDDAASVAFAVRMGCPTDVHPEGGLQIINVNADPQ